jgi:hypothetical protein
MVEFNPQGEVLRGWKQSDYGVEKWGLWEVTGMR